MGYELALRFGKRIRELRNERGFTQQELADRAGTHITYIARIEAGQRNPSLRSIAALARGLGVSISALMEGVDA